MGELIECIFALAVTFLYACGVPFHIIVGVVLLLAPFHLIYLCITS